MDIGGRTLNVLLAGIGGQGVLTASQLLTEAAVQGGHDVKKSEVHGMAQRGGVVTSHVRIGRKVYSPIISSGEVDLLVAFEEAEALRWRPEVRPGGTLIVNCLRVAPPIVNLGHFKYPDDPLESLRSFNGSLLPVEASALAIQAGSPRLAGTILVGAAAAVLPLSVEHWEAAIRTRFATREVTDQNLKAFHQGREYAISLNVTRKEGS
ncbi:MAG: indolepyruvate oxidoreductase subunit beta [candidate division NC10 bacterium]|nr:indolepyruvate oxidoreductase subunit beta [candidate division NC10 bacterium]